MKMVGLAFGCFFATTALSVENPEYLTSTATIEAKGGNVVMTEHIYPDGRLERRYQRGTTLLYQSRVRPTRNGFLAQIVAGHPMQLGSLSVDKGRLTVEDPQGKLLWTEVLKAPLCLPELTAEFVQAHWDELTIDGPVLRCGVPIIKARKVAPVQWDRLPDAENGERVVELQPGSFGMRFFLSPTRMTFSADGKRLLTQRGQFEATRDPSGRPSYLLGFSVINNPRDASRWSKDRFGSEAAAP